MAHGLTAHGLRLTVGAARGTRHLSDQGLGIRGLGIRDEEVRRQCTWHWTPAPALGTGTGRLAPQRSRIRDHSNGEAHPTRHSRGGDLQPLAADIEGRGSADDDAERGADDDVAGIVRVGLQA